jgi:hypothetical protein
LLERGIVRRDEEEYRARVAAPPLLKLPAPEEEQEEEEEEEERGIIGISNMPSLICRRWWPRNNSHCRRCCRC